MAHLSADRDGRAAETGKGAPVASGFEDGKIEHAVIDEATIDEAERRAAEACAALRRSPRLRDGGDPIYALPWFLVVGDSRAFLTAASRSTSFPRLPSTGGAKPSPLSWWLTDTLVAAALGAEVTGGTQAPGTALSWGLERFLAVIVKHRPLRPLDGLIVTVAADALGKDAQGTVALGRCARRIADEWQRSVGFRLPVFVIVTGLETMAGHGAMVSALPREIAEKAVGVRLDHGLSPEARLNRLSKALDGLESTLARLRLGMLLAGGEALDRRSVFRLPVEFAALRRGLTPLIAALVKSDETQHAVELRGVYFAATGGGGAHLDNIVEKLLPTDAALCSRV